MFRLNITSRKYSFISFSLISSTTEATSVSCMIFLKSFEMILQTILNASTLKNTLFISETLSGHLVIVVLLELVVHSTILFLPNENY